MPSKHIAMVIHGARADRPDVRHLVNWVRDKGHFVEPLITFEAGDAAGLAADAARRGADVVAAAGGDGTVNGVVNGLDGYDVPLGIIPVGTANDFARAGGHSGGRRSCHGCHPTTQAASIGHGIAQRPAISQRVDRRRGRRGDGGDPGRSEGVARPDSPMRSAACVNSPDSKPQFARFVGDGFSFEGQLLMFAVGSTRSTGGGTLVTPMASATDGLLDLCIVEDMSRGDFARIVLRLKRGEHVGEDGVRYVQVKSVTIEAVDPIAVNIDGEISNAGRLTYRARARDLWVHVAHLPGEVDD